MSLEQKPCVSVIIPACRRPQFLQEAMASVLAQTFRDLELIVVDDDPAFSAREIVSACHDARVSYFSHGQNRGGSAARNTGLRQARGRYIAFLDDDDLWQPSFLEKMLELFSTASSMVGVVYCPVEFVDANGSRVQSRISARSRGDLHEDILKGERSIVSTVALVRREVFDVCGGFDESLPSAQDWDFWIRASRSFHFDHVDSPLALVRVYGERISSDPFRPIASRERIFEKYARELEAHPKARLILVKRLGKLNACAGRWAQAWGWFREAWKGSPREVLKVWGWVLFRRPFIPPHGVSGEFTRYGVAAFLLSFPLLVYSQLSALRSAYVINDDVCQHVWWTRVLREPGLFPNDLLMEYARSLQNVGIISMYHVVTWVMDPLLFTKLLPFILFPVAAWALFRLVFFWTRTPYAAFLTTLAFMVTPIYLQHMTGGQAHSFGYTLLILFLYFFATGKHRAAVFVMTAGAFFFPVVFILALMYWLASSCFAKGRARFGSVAATLGVGIFLGALTLAVKFLLLHDPLIGTPLSKAVVSRMPELTAAGRWEVWPVMPVWEAVVVFAERGVFLFKGIYKTIFPDTVKAFLMTHHVLFGLLAMPAALWWYRARREVAFRPLGILVAVSVFLYLAASAVILKLYAPDRYVSYSVTLAALIFFTVPFGMCVSGHPDIRLRRSLKIVCVLLVLACAFLTKNAGLTDYAGHARLYAFLKTLPRTCLIAAYPDTADGIPLFSRRSVFLNEELSVALYDRYWETIKVRTFDLFSAYYAPDRETVAGFFLRNGITHLVIERSKFSPEFLGGRVYFEPFGSWVRKNLASKKDFYLQGVEADDCVFMTQDICVITAERF